MTGFSVSPGISIGVVEIKKNFKDKIVKKFVEDTSCEIEKLEYAIEKVIEHTKKRIEKEIENEGFLKKVIELLEDDEITNQVILEIKGRKINAEYAFNCVMGNYISILKTINHGQEVRARIAVVRVVIKKVLQVMIRKQELSAKESGIKKVLVSRTLKPEDTVQIDTDYVVGFVTEEGGETSHAAIMAKTLEIPAVLGVDKVVSKVKDGDKIIVDGYKGRIILNPSERQIKKYKLSIKRHELLKQKLKKYIGQPTRTLDDFNIELSANISTLIDLKSVIKYDSEGIGLFRTEFLYMNQEKKLPTEEEQFEIYKKVAEVAEDKPVVIRTLDAGGDTDIDYLNMPKEENPFLGYRAIRFCLDNREIFISQIRAILRASHYGNLRVMFPFVSSYEEVLEAKQIIFTVMKDLKREGVPFDETIEIGVMIEVPSAAVIADVLAEEVDFFSIGTNDLIQYTIAVDRMNECIKDLYNPYHPAVIRLIKNIIDAGHRHGIWVGMCGEMASDELMLPILIGMEIDELSTSPNKILQLRYMINDLSRREMKKHVNAILNMKNSQSIKKYLIDLDHELGIRKYY